VASIYLNILFAKENLQNAENQIKLTNEQLVQLNKQISVGNRPENDRLELYAQVASNEQTIVEAQNNLYINFLNLKQLLRLDPEKDIDVMSPRDLNIGSDPELLTFAEVYDVALRNQPSVAANELRLKSAYLGEKIAASQLMPTLAAGGSLRTNYSNKGRSISGYQSSVSEQTVYINNQPVTVGFPQELPQFEKTPYFNQFSNNLSYGVSLSLSIPIYNNNIARGNLNRARLNAEQANLNLTQIKETLKITVGQALADAKAAKTRYMASEKTRNAQKNLFNNATKRFELGNLNAFELTRLKTQMESAEINALIAKYNYIFRAKVLDFYLGKPILLIK
jgi:outer membrane protein